MRTLASLAPGERGIIAQVRASGPLLNRLLALGFTPGTAVQCLFAAPFGQPVAYRLRGFTLALGQKQGEMILLGAQKNQGQEGFSISSLPL